MIRSAFAALAVLLVTVPAHGAADPKQIGTYKSWSVWTYSQQKRDRCFIYATPAKATPAALDHGLVSFFVRSTVRPDLRSEASLQVGYKLKEGSAVMVDIDGETFRFGTVETGAWLADPKHREADLLEAIKSGSTMTVSAFSGRGNKTGYVFPLAGVTDAMKKLRATCP